ncbi:MAG: hypothetical protein MJ145_00215 [Clostridia bacterium]|nr:hypothetical protein [Clostridia bacterium]
MKSLLRNKRGMEMVQVAILIAIAIVVGLVFKDEISDFVEGVFNTLTKANFAK